MSKISVIQFSWLLLIVVAVVHAQSQVKQLSKDEKDRIYFEEISPLVSQRGNVDWEALEKQFETKYGPVGQELVLKAKPDYYATFQDWANMYKTLSEFIGKYGTDAMKPGSLNDYSWHIFENFADEKVLEETAKWSLQIVQKSEHTANEPAYIDTYANLLYRLGRKKEGLDWEQKAIDLATNADAKKMFQPTLDKMKKGEPTWPTPLVRYTKLPINIGRQQYITDN